MNLFTVSLGHVEHPVHMNISWSDVKQHNLVVIELCYYTRT
jgi:hypothetical protein